jgi:hypothetical protein
MSARGRDLQCQPRLVLPDDVTQIGNDHGFAHLSGGGRHARRVLASLDGLVASHQVPKVARRHHLDARDKGSLGGVGRRDHDLSDPQARGGKRDGQHPSHRADRAVQAKLADMDDALHRIRRERVGGGEDGDGDGKVPTTADLRNRGGREVDRQTPLRDRHTGVRRRDHDPVRGLPTGRIGQPAEDDLRQPLLKSGLHVDQRTLDPLQGDPPRTTQAHAVTATRCSIWAGPRRGRSTPTTSIRTSATESTSARCSASQHRASRRSRRALTEVTASTGDPKARLRRVLTSTMTRHRSSKATISISPLLAAPVAVQDLHA